MVLTERHYLIILVLAVLTVYANSLNGGFVYDDDRQILMNVPIQQPTLYGQALTSDVWGFKGSGSITASNYYRPTFVLWLIVNFALFGPNPFGWHLSNVLLHATVCVLAYLLFRQVGFKPIVSFVLGLIFAVHPVHVENVCWISGSPDILFSIFFLSSVLLTYRFLARGSLAFLGAAVVSYLLALGAKEIAIFCFPVYYLVFLDARSRVRILKAAMPLALLGTFALAAILFFVGRWWVLGQITHQVEDAPGTSDALLSLPAVFVFYVRQALFPLFLAENYPLRPVGQIAITTFLVPAIISLVIIAALWFAARKSVIRQLGLALFFLPLLPALFVGSFPAEQIVHDRYLYFPLVGLLIVGGSLVQDMAARPVRTSSFVVARFLAAAVIVLFSIQTVAYGRVWANGLTLWEYNVTADPGSSASWTQYGTELLNRGRSGEAISAFNRSLEIRRSSIGLISRARALSSLGRFDEALRDLNSVISLPDISINAYSLFQAYEVTAIVYADSGRLHEAEDLLRKARARLPIYHAALTDKLAIVLYNQGRKQDALAELNTARNAAQKEMLPASKSVFFRLGMLEAELGDPTAARSDLNYFLDATATFADGESALQRSQAADTLTKIR